MKKMFLLLLTVLFMLMSVRASAFALFDTTQPTDNVLFSSLPSYMRALEVSQNVVLGMEQWIPVTSNYTASDTSHLLVDTSLTPITIMLPANPTMGMTVTLLDGMRSWTTNNVTVAGNGRLIMGSMANYILSAIPYETITYYNSTEGWVVSANNAFDPTNPGPIGSRTPAAINGTTISGATINGIAINGSTISGTTISGTTLTLSNPLAISTGGTGSTTASGALANLLTGWSNPNSGILEGSTFSGALTTDALGFDSSGTLNLSGGMYMPGALTIGRNLSIGTTGAGFSSTGAITATIATVEPSDASLQNGTFTFWFNPTLNQLHIKVKTPTGIVYDFTLS
jgi:hypothetical protein